MLSMIIKNIIFILIYFAKSFSIIRMNVTMTITVNERMKVWKSLFMSGAFRQMGMYHEA